MMRLVSTVALAAGVVLGGVAHAQNVTMRISHQVPTAHHLHHMLEGFAADVAKNSGGSVTGYHIYMCGPLPMVQAFEKKFFALGVPANNIHYEEFNFR